MKPNEGYKQFKKLNMYVQKVNREDTEKDLMERVRKMRMYSEPPKAKIPQKAMKKPKPVKYKNLSSELVLSHRIREMKVYREKVYGTPEYDLIHKHIKQMEADIKTLQSFRK